MEYKEAIVVSCKEIQTNIEGIYIKKAEKNFVNIIIKGHTVRGYPEQEICPFFMLKDEKYLVILKNTALYDLIDTKIGLKNKIINSGQVKTINLNDFFKGEN